MTGPILIWLQFLVCAALIGRAFLATATSLPELVTGITSATVANAPNLTLGNASANGVLNLFLRPRSRVLRAVGWVSLGLLAVYLLNTYDLYLYGD